MRRDQLMVHCAIRQQQALAEAREELAALRAENAALKEERRWRKWPEEMPEASGYYLIRYNPECSYNIAWWSDDVMEYNARVWKNIMWWLPITGPEEPVNESTPDFWDAVTDWGKKRKEEER